MSDDRSDLGAKKVDRGSQRDAEALLVNFIDFEKAFDLVFRQGLWTILRGY